MLEGGGDFGKETHEDGEQESKSSHSQTREEITRVWKTKVSVVCLLVGPQLQKFEPLRLGCVGGKTGTDRSGPQTPW